MFQHFLKIEHITVMYGAGWMESSLLLKYVMFLEIGVKKLAFESGKGLDFLKSENVARTAAVQECATILLNNVRGVHSMIYFSHT